MKCARESDPEEEVTGEATLTRRIAALFQSHAAPRKT
jgi:hypothetical protein